MSLNLSGTIAAIDNARQVRSDAKAAEAAKKAEHDKDVTAAAQLIIDAIAAEINENPSFTSWDYSYSIKNNGDRTKVAVIYTALGEEKEFPTDIASEAFDMAMQALEDNLKGKAGVSRLTEEFDPTATSNLVTMRITSLDVF